MSFRNQVTQAAKQGLSHAGRPVTLVNQEAETDANGDIVRDDYNDVVWQDPTRTETKATIAPRGTPTFEKRADSVSDDIDAVARLDPDDTVSDGSDDEGQKATRIEVDGSTWAVRSEFIASDGLRECHCEREG